jgi:hypothetical protein
MKMAIIERGEKPLPLDEEDAQLLIDSGPLRSGPQRFTPEQMVRCEACLRANPPTRTSCLYCAAQLPATEASEGLQRPTLRRLENWEQGFNVILLPGSGMHLSTETLKEMALLVRLEVEDLSRILEANLPLPVALAATSREAALIERGLSEMGLKTLVVADNDLGLEDAPQKRARSLELTDEALTFQTGGGGEVSSVAWADVELMVAGRIIVREIEIEERKGRSTEKEILDARELSADEAVLDVYAQPGGSRWRIAAGNFDFSCLGSRKSLLAAQNYLTLVETLRVRAVRAAFDDSYNRVRHALAVVWPLGQQTESRGWHRKRPGQVSTEAVTRIDNEAQFNRYSLLRHYLGTQHSEQDV